MVVIMVQFRNFSGDKKLDILSFTGVVSPPVNKINFAEKFSQILEVLLTQITTEFSK